MKFTLYVLVLFFASFSFAQTNIELKTTSGEAIQSQHIMNNGKQKVFVFWSRYCQPCKLEMKGIRNVGANWLTDYNAEVYFVSLESYPSDAYQKLDFLGELQSQSGKYFLHDNQMKLYHSFGSSTIPFTIIVDEQGNLLRQWDSYDSGLETSIGLYLKKFSKKSIKQISSSIIE